MVLSNAEIDKLCIEIVSNAFSKSLVSRFFFELLYMTGLRYNDVGLSFLCSHDEEFIYIFPSKRNNLRKIEISSIPVAFFDFCKGYDTPIYRIHYQTLIRNFTQCNPYTSLSIGSKEVVLHLFRHNYMKKLFDAGKSIAEIAVITGEKHVSSASNYVLSHIVI